MNATAPTIVGAIDIGNTNVHVGLIDIDAVTCRERHEIPTAAVALSPTAITGVLPPEHRAIPWVIAGGRNGLASRIEEPLRAAGITRLFHLGSNERLPVEFTYDTPEQLGADRIANALYAVTRVPRRDTVTISSGTAITIDLVTGSGVFLGGVIMAGIPAQLRGLQETAPVLPRIGIPRAEAPLPGHSTVACMSAGIVHGVAGAINHIVAAYRANCSGEPLVLATGGGWDITAPHCDFPFTFEPAMTLIGTALFLRYC